MNELSIISESINTLQQVSGKGTILLDDIHWRFRPDLQNFIIGETLSMKNGKIVIGSNLYKKWLFKIRTRGFDYEIDFNDERRR